METDINTSLDVAAGMIRIDLPTGEPEQCEAKGCSIQASAVLVIQEGDDPEYRVPCCKMHGFAMAAGTLFSALGVME